MSRRIKDWFTTRPTEGGEERREVPDSLILPLLSPHSSLAQFSLHLCPRMVASAPHCRWELELLGLLPDQLLIV